MISTIWRTGNLGLAFALELAAIAALAYWGFHTGTTALTKTALGIGAPLVAIVLWALFAAPKATFSSPALYVITVVLVFGGAALALWSAGHQVLGVLLVVVFLANLAIIKGMRLTA